MGHERTYALQEANKSKYYLTRLLEAIVSDEASALANRLIDEFGSLGDLFSSDLSTLLEACRGSEVVASYLSFMGESIRHALRFQIMRGPVLSHLDSLRDYLVCRLGFVTHEIVLGLFLDSRNALIKDVVLSQGTLSQAPVFPREIVKQALGLGAASLILVHNHPSGDSEASRADIQMTRRIVEACRTIDVIVHDHIIVARTGLSSMRAKGQL